MKPYHYYVPAMQLPTITQQAPYDPFRQQPTQGTGTQTAQLQEMQRISSELARQNQEILRLNTEINRINQELTRQIDVLVRHSRNLNRLNQRLRVVENRLTIPFKPNQEGF